MNISDVNVKEARKRLEGLVGSQEGFSLIFFRQRELIEAYIDIERNNGFWKPGSIPVDLNIGRDQLFLKDLSWRTTEEVAEAFQALEHGSPLAHVQEELADGLHFITELLIYSGIEARAFDPLENIANRWGHVIRADPDARREKYFIRVITELGWSMHCLKNKPWKTTQILTDTDVYVERLKGVYQTYIVLMVFMGMEHYDILNAYIAKSEVNLFRQRSKY